jgi:hypothetical protein
VRDIGREISIFLRFEPAVTRSLAALLLVALLACHGFLGAPHHAPGPPDHSRLTEGHPSHGPAEGVPDGHPGLRFGHSGYAVLLISFLIGATLVLLLSGVRVGASPPPHPDLRGGPYRHSYSIHHEDPRLLSYRCSGFEAFLEIKQHT